MVTGLHAGFIVKDFAEWKKGFDAHLEQRKAGGEVAFRVFRNADDPNTLTVLTEHESLEQLQAFLNSPELKLAMEQAGITKMGTMLFLEEVDSGTHG